MYVLANFIKKFEVVSGRIGTRNQGLLIRLPKIKLEVARKGFYFMGAKYFNELPCIAYEMPLVYAFLKIDLINIYYNSCHRYITWCPEKSLPENCPPPPDRLELGLGLLTGGNFSWGTFPRTVVTYILNFKLFNNFLLIFTNVL